MKYFNILFIILFLHSCEVGVSHGTKEVNTNPLNSVYLGTVGDGETGAFNVFKFEIDNVVYIVGSKFNGGVELIDKYEKYD